MKLFHAYGSCSLGIRILLEAIGAPFELEVVDLAAAQQRSPEYLAQNPKGKVPALLCPNGTILTEYPVISLWLAQTYPQANLLPTKAEDLWRALQLVEYVVSSLHMRGATLAMRPDKFVTDPQAQEAIRAHGRGVLQEGFTMLQTQLGDQDYFFDHLTIADAAVFYLLNWQPRMGIDLPPRLQSYHDRLVKLPAIERALTRI